MIHLFLNCLAANAGGGLTYLRNVLPLLSATNGIRTTVSASSSLRQELQNLPNVTWVNFDAERGAALRFCQEQTLLPRLVRKCGADVLISAGNFALWRSPVPQILLSGNSLYTSVDFYQDLRSRKDYRLWLDTRAKGILAKQSIGWADRTVAPSRAFADELRRWTGGKVVSIPHGFNYGTFCHSADPLPASVHQKLDAARDSLRLLFVSHYNYYRNFETLLRALPLVRDRLRGRGVVLFLTCKLRSNENPGSFRTEAAATLVQQLGIAQQVVELGAIPYHLLHKVYRACDIYVTPAYAETFAHPLVEAMAGGLPVVASDLPVHREVCRDAALYFERFSPDGLAEQVLRIESSRDLRQVLTEKGRSRAKEFSWDKHVDELLALAYRLDRSNPHRHKNMVLPPERPGDIKTVSEVA